MGDITISQMANALTLIAGIVGSVGIIYAFVTKASTKRFDAIDKQMKDIQDENAFILRLCSSLVLHEATGDHITDMQKLYDEVQEHFTKKAK